MENKIIEPNQAFFDTMFWTYIIPKNVVAKLTENEKLNLSDTLSEAVEEILNEFVPENEEE